MKQLLDFIKNIPPRWYVAGIVIIATGLRLISITKASIWHDEGYTMMLIKHDVLEIIARTARDVHPPLYYILTHWWSLLFGTSELAIRSFSLLCGVGIVVLVYFIIKRLRFSEATARLATLFAAFGPFLVRYSQEARMYSLAALLVCAATLVLLITLDQRRDAGNKKKLWLGWLAYGLIMGAALYTHYYAAFIVPVHIGYTLWRYGSVSSLVKSPPWWVGNLLAVVVFLPWVPTIIGQVTRVQSGFWIPPVNAETLPNTLMQFMIFTGNQLPSSVEFLLAVGLACLITVAIIRSKQRPQLLFVAGWAFIPLLIVLLVSLKQPVYYDRYFVYCAVGFYSLLAVLLTSSRLRSWIKGALVTGLLLLFSFGIYNVFDQANHQMRAAAAIVNNNYQPGDIIVSAELYTYFDFSYYNQTDATLKLLSSGPLSGYGETSLLYDKQADIVISQLSDIQRTDTKQRVWVIGKTGQHDYFTTDIPASWQQIKQFEAGDSAVRLYKL